MREKLINLVKKNYGSSIIQKFKFGISNINWWLACHIWLDSFQWVLVKIATRESFGKNNTDVPLAPLRFFNDRFTSIRESSYSFSIIGIINHSAKFYLDLFSTSFIQMNRRITDFDLQCIRKLLFPTICTNHKWITCISNHFIYKTLQQIN